MVYIVVPLKGTAQPQCQTPDKCAAKGGTQCVVQRYTMQKHGVAFEMPRHQRFKCRIKLSCHKYFKN